MSAYTVDEVDAALRSLDDLLSVICDIQFDLSAGEKDDRIDSLLWIARDLSCGIIKLKDEKTARGAPKQTGASS